tara:strand:+ start:2706 stop:3209 length:504 start_codon:yes stop_codon:yes gene_type:complete
MELTQELVKRSFDYKEDGNLIWIKKEHNSPIKIGDIAGSVNDIGYVIIGFNGKNHKAHRLIFLWHKGYLPAFIDHKETLSNRIQNLRECTRQENGRNRKSHKGSSSIYKGVSLNKKSNKWHAQTQVNNKRIYLGRYDDEKQAAIAYNNYAKENFGEFARLNIIEEDT